MERRESSDMDVSPERVSELERANQLKCGLTHFIKSLKRATLEKLRSRGEWSRRESSDMDVSPEGVSELERANQSKCGLTHFIKSLKRATLEKLRSRRESNPHLRFRNTLSRRVSCS